MIHIDDGALRRYCDEAGYLDDGARAHLAACLACAERLVAIRADAKFVARALEAGADGSATSDRWPSVRKRIATARRPLAYGPWLAAAAAAAAIAALFAFTPVGTFAQSFLTIFEPQQFVAVPVSRADLGSLPDLRRFGTVVERARPQIREVASAAQAASLARMHVEVPSWLPAGVPHAVRYAVTSGADTTFTFEAVKALANAPPHVRSSAMMPSKLNGAMLEVSTGAAVVIAYGGSLPHMHAGRTDASGDQRSGSDDRSIGDLPPLVIVQAPLPSVTSTGATVAQIEEYLLRQPGVSPALAAEIRAIGDPATTMPIPIPIDRAFGQQVTVHGVRGLGIGDNTGVGGVVVWQRAGIIYVVAGQLRQRDILAVAESLR